MPPYDAEPPPSDGPAASDGAQLPDGNPPSIDDRLVRLRAGVVGRWRGTVTTPWRAPYQVTLALAADGRYSAHCLQPQCIALYWGSDDESPEKIYRLQDIRADGNGTGEIAIWFMPGDTNRGEMRGISLGDGTLTFEVWKQTYGPLVFDLRRD